MSDRNALVELRRLLGPSAPTSGIGTVQESKGGLVTVTSRGGKLALPNPDAIDVAAGDLVTYSAGRVTARLSGAERVIWID